MIFRDEKNAKQLLSTEETAAKPLGFGAEAFNAAWDSVRREEQSVSMDRAFADRFGAYIDEVEKLTGERLSNPIQPRSNFSPADLLFHGGKGGARQHDYGQFLEEVDRLRSGRDDVPDPPDPNTMLEEIIADYDVKRRERADLRSRQTAGGAFADFLGRTVGAVEDPVVLATLPFGASASSGILRTALTEAGISVAVDLPIQLGPVSETKDVLGVEFTTGDAVANALTAGAFAGGIGGAIAGVAKGARALKGKRRVAGDREVIEAYHDAVGSGALAETAESARAVEALERDLDIAETSPLERTAENDIFHEESFNTAYEALQRGTPISVPMDRNSILSRSIASSGDDLIAEIMTETHIPKDIRARFHEAVSEARTHVSVSAPGVYGNIAEYERLVARQDELLATPRTKKNRAKLNKEIAQLANQIEELRQPRTVATASRERDVPSPENYISRPADDVAEEEADAVLKADLKRAVEEHGEDFEIPISETIDEGTGQRAASTTTLRQVMLDLDEADQIADELASCLLSGAGSAA